MKKWSSGRGCRNKDSDLDRPCRPKSQRNKELQEEAKIKSTGSLWPALSLSPCLHYLGGSADSSEARPGGSEGSSVGWGSRRDACGRGALR